MNLITDEELDVLNQAILNRYGLNFFHYEKLSFRRRVSRILHRFDLGSVYDLWRKILFEPHFISTFINEITVGLTSLFRNPILWQYVRDELLYRFSSQETVHIWHAGCSTGEEVYSLRISQYECKLRLQIESLATDISPSAIQTSTQGLISSDLLESYQINYKFFTNLDRELDYYYEKQGDQYVFKDFLREGTTFHCHNLTKDSMDQKFDVIFCRNVLIYFDAVFKDKVLSLFHQALKPRGLLILGYYDVMPQEGKYYFNMYQPNYKIFERKEPEIEIDPETTTIKEL